MIWIIISSVIALVDQIVKYKIVSNILPSDSVKVIDGFFYLTHIKNRGAAWSMMQNGRIFFIILAIVGCIGIIYYLFKPIDKTLKLALSFIMGGTLGNLVDRIVSGEVTDFFEFHFGEYVFPIFNIADIFIVIGTFIFAVFIIYSGKFEKKNT